MGMIFEANFINNIIIIPLKCSMIEIYQTDAKELLEHKVRAPAADQLQLELIRNTEILNNSLPAEQERTKV